MALDGGLSLAAGPHRGASTGQRVQVAIRQENIRLAPADAGLRSCRTSSRATVVFHAFAGQAHHYVIQLADGRELEVTAPGRRPPMPRGASAVAGWGRTDVVLLADGGADAGGGP